MSKKIITFLSLLKSEEVSADEVYQYPLGDPRRERGETLSGRQTNEAPIKYFLDTYGFQGEGDKILCLCTKAVMELRFDWAKKTSFEYVKARLEEYCRKQGRVCPELISISVADLEEDLEKALAELMERVSPGDRVYIDTTGGPRDANFMNILLLQALQYKGCPVEEMVYGFYSREKSVPNSVRKLDNVSRIMRLTSAMAEFTTYGRTRLLEQMEGELDRDTRDLVNCLKQFAETLEISSYSSNERSPKLGKQLQRINRSLDTCEASEEVRPLMKQLLPVFRDKMTFGRRGMNLSSVVRWCAENYLLQQGVTIFNENLFDELYRLNAIKVIENERKGREVIRHSLVVSEQFLYSCAEKGIAIRPNDEMDGEMVRRYQQRIQCRTGQLKRGLGKAALQDVSTEPDADVQLVEPAALLMLNCFLEAPSQLRDREAMARFAIRVKHQELLPLIARQYEVIRNAFAGGMSRLVALLARPSFSEALTDTVHALYLEKLGLQECFTTVIGHFMNDPELPQEYVRCQRWARPHAVEYRNNRTSPADLGVLFFESQLMRLIRNQMCHSARLGQDFAQREFAAFTKLGMDSLLREMPIREIQNHMLLVAESLGRLERQAQAGDYLLNRKNENRRS